MIKISDKSLCCGCTACMNACPVQCIVMRRDREGFDYPVANPDRCIGCGKCEAVCPVLHPSDVVEPLEVLAARSGEYVAASSSGGVFPELARRVLDDGGVVFGSVMNDDMTVGHADAEDMAGVERMRGSKYVQSDLYGTFEEAKYYLEEGRKVLFTGTPCQIAGLRSYLGRQYDGLIAVDCACHGVPSPGLFEKYVAALGKKEGYPVRSLKFRDKSSGWMHYHFTYSTAEATVAKPYWKDPYMALFVQDMTLRPSCYSCPARNGRSGADLTLADLWSVADVLPEMNDDKGGSAVLVNTEKGQSLLVETGISATKLDQCAAVKNNGGFVGRIIMPERREEFFKGYHSAPDLIAYMKRYMLKRSVLKILCRTVRSGLSKLKRRIMK